MRIATFLFALSLAAALVLADTSSLKPSPVHLPAAFPVAQRNSISDGVRMLRRAEIRVLPLDVVVANRTELEVFRDRVARAKADSAGLYLSDPAVRQQLARQILIMDGLLSYAERLNSDVGKDATAMEVQRNLNHIEGQMMCEACHTTVIANFGQKGEHHDAYQAEGISRQPQY